jgi:glycosyltransferase involved in cell wall biosynthesis
MPKILFITNIAKKVGSFSIASINAAHDCNLQFHIAANWSTTDVEQLEKEQEKFDVVIHNIPLARSPYFMGNIRAYKELVKIIKTENIEFIHCNTPVGGLLGRLAGKKCKVKKVLYQAHGFHFYKGAPLKNWLLYYPVERILAHYTDALITINQEDYKRAQKFHLRKHGKVYYVPGVGIDTSQYITDKQLRTDKRNELGLKSGDVALISMGDLIARKNYPLAIEAVAKANNPELHYFICGQGLEESKLKELVKKLNLENQIHFLGYRIDIKELLNAADIFLFTSKQEGLARSLMEAMASGLPCIASNIRGNSDLLNSRKGGFLCDELSEYVEAIQQLAFDTDLRTEMGVNNIENIQQFSLENATKEVRKIYLNEVCGGYLVDV